MKDTSGAQKRLEGRKIINLAQRVFFFFCSKKMSGYRSLREKRYYLWTTSPFDLMLILTEGNARLNNNSVSEDS